MAEKDAQENDQAIQRDWKAFAEHSQSDEVYEEMAAMEG